ncbi:MAG TPA: tRNA modification GTPase [Gemmatimonadaceae bacterium]
MATVKEYLSTIGRHGGLKSRRTLDAGTARDMVRVREARRAYRRYHTMCFWSYRPDLKIAREDVAWVAEQLMKHGNREAWNVAVRLRRDTELQPSLVATCNHSYRDDTIVALSTAPGRGAIALVRLSGPRAVEIARGVCTPWPGGPRGPGGPGGPGGPQEPRVATLATIHSPGDPAEVIDHGLVTHFPTPHSYTGEDVVEIAVHGGTLVSTLVVAACVEAGARPALPGEFTERAVLHGKMDLVQAEAVADLIDARSRAAHRSAVRQLDGALSRRLGAVRDALLQVDALLAYEIDFPEEDEAPPSRERVLTACDEAMAQVGRLLATLPAAALGREGALVVLAGPPNAGKSSLLNALVGEARVLVSEIPGTTRDAVEVLVDDTPYPLRLVDTAGLRESGDALERLGIEVSERYVAQAHVVLACADSREALEQTIEIVRGLTAGAVVPVLCKADLCSGRSGIPKRAQGYTKELLQKSPVPEPVPGSALSSLPGPAVGAVRVSANTGEGLDELRTAIRAAVTLRVATPDEETPMVTRARHEAGLRCAGEELRLFREAWAQGALPAPVAATHLRAAVTALEELIGAVDVEDVLERVFRSFCVGK